MKTREEQQNATIRQNKYPVANKDQKRSFWQNEYQTATGGRREEANKMLKGLGDGMNVVDGGTLEQQQAPTQTTGQQRTNAIQQYQQATAPTKEQDQIRNQLVQQLTTPTNTEQQYTNLQQELGRDQAQETVDIFTEEVQNIEGLLKDMRDGIKNEGGAITKAMASRIEERRGTPLREQLASMVEGQQTAMNNLASIDDQINKRIELKQLDRAKTVSNLEKAIDLMAVPDSQKEIAKIQLQQRLDILEQQDKLEADQQKYLFQKQVEQEIDQRQRALDMQEYVQKKEIDTQEQAILNKQKAQLEAYKLDTKYGNLNSQEPSIQKQAIRGTIESIMDGDFYKGVPLPKGIEGAIEVVWRKFNDGKSLDEALYEEVYGPLENNEQVKANREAKRVQDAKNKALLNKTYADLTRKQQLINRGYEDKEEEEEQPEIIREGKITPRGEIIQPGFVGPIPQGTVPAEVTSEGGKVKKAEQIDKEEENNEAPVVFKSILNDK